MAMIRRSTKSNPLTKLIPRFAIVLTLVLSMSSAAFAQNPQNAPGSLEKNGKAVSGPRKQLATIIFAGLGGAILGLSTLSFYGRPQENLRNIAIGAAFGVISGTILVTYKAATNPSELYGEQRQLEREFSQTSLASARAPSSASERSPLGAPLGMNLTFEF